METPGQVGNGRSQFACRHRWVYIEQHEVKEPGQRLPGTEVPKEGGRVAAQVWRPWRPFRRPV
jgi:hypothetical protein